MLSLTRSRIGRVVLERAERPRRLIDAAGLAIFVGCGVWMMVSWARSGGTPGPGLGLLIACGLALMAARGMGPRARLLVPSAALAAAVLVAAGSRTGLFSSSPLSGPLEYVNADGAFYVQAAIAGLMLAFGAGPRLLRAVGGAAAAFFAVLPFVIHAVAAAALAIALPAVVVGSAALGPRAARAGVAFLGLMFIGTVVATVLAGATYPFALERNVFQRAALRAVDGERLFFWQDAYELMRQEPIIGVGPGRYPSLSPNARRDPQDRWAHNEFLQQGAEGGIAGLVLLALVFVWGFVRLSAGPSPDVVTLLGAASLAALGLHASIDYVMHFPAIPLMAAGLVGTGMTDRR